ncbi:MAG: hypothetical protein ABJB12_18455 [Pseudomonadota bacterium]
MTPQRLGPNCTSLLTRAPRWLALFGACAAFGCHNLDGFDTKNGDAYCASILRQPAFQDSFQPTGHPPDLQLALTLDTSKLTSEPGHLRSNDAVGGLCGDRPLFQEAPLRAIPEVDHDVISALSFGEGHEHDFFVWVDSTCQGTLLGVVSLLKNDQVELRLFKPAHKPAPDAPPDQSPGFAVFHFYAQKGGCDF